MTADAAVTAAEEDDRAAASPHYLRNNYPPYDRSVVGRIFVSRRYGRPGDLNWLTAVIVL